MARITIQQEKILYQDGGYNSFPNIIRLDEKILMMVFRAARNTKKTYGKISHIDPESKVCAIRSFDNGRTWEAKASEIFNDEDGAQDPCINLVSDGSLICTFFKWKVVDIEEKAKLGSPEEVEHFSREIHDKWAAMCDGSYSIKSADQGRTWSEPIKLVAPSYIHGVGLRGNIVELQNGCLLLPMYGIKNIGELSSVYIMYSDDKADSWRFLEELPADPEKNFLEPFLLKTASSKLIVFQRTQSDYRRKDFEESYLNFHTSESFNGGKTWGPLTDTGLYSSNPLHALALANDKGVLISYGYRKEPFGMRAKILDSECKDIGIAPEYRISRSFESGDLGYPSAVSLNHDSALVAYYGSKDDGSSAIYGSYLDLSI